MTHRHYELKIKTRAPFLFPGPQAGRLGLDMVALRDWTGENLVLPQDQLRGILRAQIALMLEELDESDPRHCVFRSLFGHGSGDALMEDAGSFEPDGRAKIFFCDLMAPLPTPQIETAAGNSVPTFTRVEIEPDSGAAKPGHLLKVEQVFPAGAEITFAGGLDVVSDDPELAETLLRNAVRSLDQIGRFETIGFGEITGWSLESSDLEEYGGECPEYDLLQWEFAVDRPYLVNADRMADNVFRGQASIPGGALKGTLIRNMAMHGVDVDALSDDLAELRISHSSPEVPAKIVPISVGVRDGAVVDCLGEEDPTRIKLKVDFKADHHRLVSAALGLGEGATERFDERVHTAIDPDSGAARDEMLYSTLAVCPTANHVAQIDFAGVTASAREIIIYHLRQPLLGLGKTMATVRTRRVSEDSLDSPAPFSGTAYAVIVETPALMLEPEQGTVLPDLFSAFWRKVLPGSVMLDFYAEVHPAGGYVGRRFCGDDGKFRPFWLTQPGSVFLLDMAGASVGELEQLTRHGVCLPDVDGRPTGWQTCPFVPANGYGKISASWTGVTGS